MMSGHDWAFALPQGHTLEFVDWRGDQPPRIRTRDAGGALVVYSPKPGSRIFPAIAPRPGPIFSPTD